MEYNDIITQMRETGEKTRPRGIPVFELPNMRYEFPIGTLLHREGFNPIIGIMEGLGVVAGQSVKPQLQQVAPKTFKQGYFDSKTDYGARAGTHWMDAVNALLDDKESRSAQFAISRNTDRADDKPCTLAVQAQIRNNHLHLTSYMRSLDVVRGLAVDVQIWNVLADAMRAILIKQYSGLKFGNLTIFAGNAHLYYTDYNIKGMPNGIMQWDCVNDPAHWSRREIEYPNWRVHLDEWRDRESMEPVYMGYGFVLNAPR